MPENPFIDKIYIIYESPLWTSCDKRGPSSRILTINDSILQGYTIEGPSDFFTIEKYIANELKKFFAIVDLAKRCDMYGIAMDDKKDKQKPFLYIPLECNATFSNFSKQSIDSIKEKSKELKYESQLKSGDNIFDNYTFTDGYLKDKKSINDKKQLCQRLEDLSKMMLDLTNILAVLNTPENTQQFQEQYQYIMEKHKTNLALRKELGDKMAHIEMQDKEHYGDSKLYLDSTVYTSVLWTILATTIVFYIFKKM